jgi:hypothetical protein
MRQEHMPSPVYESLGQVRIIEMTGLSVPSRQLIEGVPAHSTIHAQSLNAVISSMLHILLHATSLALKVLVHQITWARLMAGPYVGTLVDSRASVQGRPAPAYLPPRVVLALVRETVVATSRTRPGNSNQLVYPLPGPAP